VNKKQRKRREKQARHHAHNAAKGVSMPGKENETITNPGKTNDTHSDSEPRKAPSNPPKWEHIIQWWEHIIQWADHHSPITTLILTVALVYIGTMQACIYREQLSVMRMDQRAWIKIYPAERDGKEIRAQIEIGKPISVPLLINNTGRSPAREIDGNFATVILSKDQPLNFEYGHRSSWHVGVKALAPELPQPIDAMAIQDDQVIYDTKAIDDALVAGNSRVFTYGIVTYCDAFRKKHTTSLCTFTGPPGITASTPAMRDAIYKCGHYTDTDSELE